MNNAKLTNLIELSSSVRVYVPSTTDIDTPTDSSEVLLRVQNNLTMWFGGSTTFDAVGCWSSPTVGLVKEAVKIVQAHTDEATLKNTIDKVIDLATWIKAEMSQDAVAIEINNKLYLV